MSTVQVLRADCANCCGLCCVAPAFDAAQGFGFSKPAHAPCANLRTDFRCGIYAERPARGFPACAAFDCFGAGQFVTQRLFGGQTWRASPQLAARMFTAYSRYRGLHELMALLELAIARALQPDRARLSERLGHIRALCDSGAALAHSVRLSELRAEVLREVRARATPRYAQGSGARDTCAAEE